MLDNLKLGRQISIHALRGEGDNSGSYACGGDKYFNPRPPWGGRRVPHDILVLTARTISIHALRGEGDRILEKCVAIEVKFQSTPSVGRATATTG